MTRMEWVRSKVEGKILEVGSAGGVLFEGTGLDVHYCDINEFPLPNFIMADAHNLPFPDGNFNTVCVCELLEHVRDPLQVLKEVARVSSRKVIFTVPFEYLWTADKLPFVTIEKKMKESGLSKEEEYKVGNPTVTKINSTEESFHREWFTRASLEDLLKRLGLPYYIELLEYDGWAFLVGEISKPSPVAPLRVPGNDKLKVALLSTPFMKVPPDRYGGLERIVADLAYGLAQAGHQVTVFAPDGSKVEGCEMVCFGPPIDKVHVDWMEAERNAVNIVADRIMNDGYSIIHGHNWMGFEYALKAQRPKLKVCHTHHGGLSMDWWGISKPPWRLNLIALSNWMQRYYQSLGFSSRIVYNGIPIEDYGFKAEKGGRLLFVGRLDSFKQPHIAIEVAKKTGLGLDIVGGSFVYDTVYMESIKQACDGKQIKLHMDASHEEKIEFYQNAKAVIFPSKMGEPYGLIVPEANACGTAVIASRDGAIPEIIEEGVTGFVCDDVDQMVEAVGKVDRIKPEACRERVEKLFSRQVMAKNYVEAYQSILGGDEW